MLDHGVLNVPLSKRGNIDAQLDRYKRQAIAQQKADSKVKAAQHKADKAKAKELFAQYGEAMVARFGPRFGAREVRQLFDHQVKWTPAVFLAFAEKFLREVA